MSAKPAIRGIVETCINVADMGRARRFYELLFGLEAMVYDERFCAFPLGAQVLLVFRRGTSDQPIPIAGGVIPPHETVGAGHFALGVSIEELHQWRAVLAEQGVQVESEVEWDRGGRSIYFRDPDNNLVELATPGVWPNY